jgi:hypothetical protein
VASLDVKLMTKDQISASNETRNRNNETSIDQTAVSVSHKTEALHDSTSRASRIRFPTGTGWSRDQFCQLQARSNAAQGRGAMIVVSRDLRTQTRLP